VRATTDDGTGTINSYDEMGRVKLQYQWVCVMGNCSSTQTISENHDFAGNPTSLGYPSGRNLVLSYNAAARPLSVADGDETAYVSDATYAPQGALSGYLNGKSPSFTGIAHAFSYNSRLQADSIAVQTPTAMIFGLSYGYGTSNNGNVMQVTNTLNPGRTQTFTYDKLNRLTSAYSNNSSGVESWGNAYGYDAWGNLLRKGSIIGLQREYGELFDAAVDPDHLNRLSGYGYDASGNVTQNGAASYGYDAEGRMVSAGNANYTYDAQGRRVAKSDGTQYFYAPSGDVIAERSATGTWSDYIFFGGKRVARRVASGTYYYVSDHLGTARLITQADGTVCYEAVYYPWGVEQHVFTDTCPQNYKFTGKERDSETGLDNFGKRYHASSMGRFMSPDSLLILKQKLIDPQQWNMYSYVRNNPLRFIDPTGMYLCNGTQSQCDAFESARKSLLNSKDASKSQLRAAQAYGDPGKENGVHVGFADKLKSDRGGTVVGRGVGTENAPTSEHPNGMRAAVDVTILTSRAGSEETIAHEGSHIADRQGFVNAITPSGLDRSLNITGRQSEIRAYQLSIGIAQRGNQTLDYGPCGVMSECKFPPGMMPALRDQRINDLLDKNYDKKDLDSLLYPQFQ
jgi:RHS repeat-associated protein